MVMKKVINMKKTNKEVLLEVIKDTLWLFEYTKVENLSKQDYDAKATIKLGNRIDKNISALLQSEEGINELKTLLDMEDVRLNFIAARYLYPLDPKFYEKILIKYKNSLSEKINIYEVDTLISGLNKKQKVFVEQFKKLYGEDRFDEMSKM